MALKKLFLFSILLSVVTAHAKVHDIAVKNADNVIIYYNYINDGKELEVTGQDYIGSVVIPEEATYQNITRRVTSIGKYALSCCHRLTSVTIPSSVTSIGESAFHNSERLASITVEEGNTVYDSRDNCNAIIESATNTLIAGSNNTVIPQGVTSIGDHAFSGCSDLTSLTIPASVTSIGDYAFNYCTGLKTLTIPASVTSIGKGAFHGCTGLTALTIGNGLTSIGESAFSVCNGLTSVTIPGSVTFIGDFAFSCCNGLESVTIGTGLKSMGYAPFSACINLTSITVEDGNTVYDSRDDSDAIIESATNTLVVGCKNTVIPQSVTSIGDGAFSRCNGLTSVTIPSGVTSIEPFAFSGCSDLTSISVKKGNTVYDSRGNCNAIIETATNTLIAVCKNTVIPKSVTSIGKGAFSHCNYLSSVTLPKGVTSIGDGAFDYCTRLKTVKIPASVTSIGDIVFNCCYSLRDVYCYAENVPAVANPVTNDQDADFLTDGWGFLGSFMKPITLHVPASSLEVYRTTYPWKNFTKVVRLR